MRVLYIFPHPDDESFGPGPGIKYQLRSGHEVHLFTLTKGGATKQRFKYNYSIEQMGDVRCKEMESVKEVLGLTGMRIIDLPDSGLKEMDPRIIEQAVEDEIRRIDPDVVVTYAVHGVSGFHDHLVTHAIVKRVFCELREDPALRLKRFAMFTLSEAAMVGNSIFNLQTSPDEIIDCVLQANDEDFSAGLKALDCYKTYEQVINDSGVKETLTKEVYFELFQESFSPPLNDMFEQLPDSSGNYR